MSVPDRSAPEKTGDKSMPVLTCGTYRLDLSKRTHVMGIVNVTPDSFSDGGKFLNHRNALDHAHRLIDEGADIIDVGGESTRPGALPVSRDEELRRVMPVIEGLALQGAVPLSIDTTKVAVAREAVAAGAVIINDISSFSAEPEMAGLAATEKVAVVLMHGGGRPHTGQVRPAADVPLSEISSFLRERIACAESAGIGPQRIIIDPGIGFGKSVPDGNLRVIRELAALRQLGKPVLIGLSRKAFIGHVLDLGVEERDEGTAAALALAVNNGAHIVRVHDVKKMRRVVRMVDAILGIHESRCYTEAGPCA